MPTVYWATTSLILQNKSTKIIKNIIKIKLNKNKNQKRSTCRLHRWRGNAIVVGSLDTNHHSVVSRTNLSQNGQSTKINKVTFRQTKRDLRKMKKPKQTTSKLTTIEIRWTIKLLGGQECTSSSIKLEIWPSGSCWITNLQSVFSATQTWSTTSGTQKESH